MADAFPCDLIDDQKFTEMVLQSCDGPFCLFECCCSSAPHEAVVRFSFENIESLLHASLPTKSPWGIGVVPLDRFIP